jgi:hypothetical protein
VVNQKKNTNEEKGKQKNIQKNWFFEISSKVEKHRRERKK